MKNLIRRTWCEISLDHIKYNIEQIKQTAQKEVIAVVKADAYGHGDRQVCNVLSECGVAWFAVSNITEAMSLRKAGIEGHILILGYTPPELTDVLLAHDFVQTVYDLPYAKRMEQAAAALGGSLRVHIKIDTGMNRIGLLENEAVSAYDAVKQIAAFRHLRPEGIFTHFSHADSPAPSARAYTQMQQRRLETLVARLSRDGVRFSCVHSQNSAGTLSAAYPACSMVRAGIILYGLPPSGEMADAVSLRPAMSLKSVVSMVKEVPAGAEISYGRTCRTDSPKRLATVCAGYADGYPRLLSNQAKVLIRGERCPVVGRVCMDQLVADVSALDTVAAGDAVTLFGTDGHSAVTADEVAGWAKTISYEIVCGISRRVPRVYYQNNAIVDIVDHILE